MLHWLGRHQHDALATSVGGSERADTDNHESAIRSLRRRARRRSLHESERPLLNVRFCFVISLFKAHVSLEA